jgi:large exoprotein involved in heme utilization and adhesion
LSLPGDSTGVQSGLFSNAQTGTGRAGDLAVNAPRVTMQGGRILASTESTSSGAAGNLILEVGTLTLTDGAQISSSTSGPGQGGTVTVKATDAVLVRGAASGIFGSASSSGKAGQVTIVAPTLRLQEGAVIDSSTAGDGQGGNIAVQAQHIEIHDGGPSQLVALATVMLAIVCCRRTRYSGVVAEQ